MSAATLGQKFIAAVRSSAALHRDGTGSRWTELPEPPDGSRARPATRRQL